MGYGEVLIGDLIRGRIIDDRTEEWEARLRENHGLTEEELDTLAPYIEHVSHYGSRKEAIALTLLFLPFALILVALGLFFGGTTLAILAAVLTGGSIQGGGAFGPIGLFMGITALLPLLLLGLIVAFLYRRWKQYRLATEVRQHLTDDPRRLCREDDTAPLSRDEVTSTSGTTFSDSVPAPPSTTDFVRDDVVRHERHLIYFAGLGGVLALFGGVILLPMALMFGGLLTNTTGYMALGLLALGTAYLVGGGILARRRSTAAWALLVGIFLLLTTVGPLLVAGGTIVPGLIGLYLCYRTARDADYDLPGSRPQGT